MNDDQKNYWKPEDESTPEEQPVQAAPEAPVAPIEPAQPEVAPASETSPQPTGETAPVTWSAQEYVHIDKDGWWYVIFGLVTIGMIAIDVFLLKSWAYSFSILVLVMAVAVVLYIRRPPRTLTYALSMKQGLYVGERLYRFEDYKAFGLIKDGEHHSIMLIPRKRFAPGVSVYFPEDAGEQIVDILGQRLPMQELKLDLIDVLIRKLRL